MSSLRSLLRRCWLPSLLLPALLRAGALRQSRSPRGARARQRDEPRASEGAAGAGRQDLGEMSEVRQAFEKQGRRTAFSRKTRSDLCEVRRILVRSQEMFAAGYSTEPEDMPLESTEMTQDQLLNYQLMFPIGQDKSIPWNAITAYENMKAKRISELKKWKEQGPCQKELYRALYKLVKAQQRSGGEIYKFYLPNCNKNGLYHSKQCETSLDGESAGCWCVYPKNGRRIPGSPEMKGDPECQQYLNSQE
ncbi:PREDICTED: insulin-like growth factor-binding protein 1 [Pygoscelis adeliae]|uniref:insulin-like growth factor-binding protein 1 n=1 Tax=Pygoscelis adeliae TaxID=9238 RepID=UPI0004F4FBBC|nr:PREDICTED: insulin-like growth factor-binding protein 1 [Pygoscelis adeliae]